jgi:hypothetical protein
MIDFEKRALRDHVAFAIAIPGCDDRRELAAVLVDLRGGCLCL